MLPSVWTVSAGGMTRPFRSSLVRCPVTKVSTVTTSTRYPAASARFTSSLVSPSSFWMYSCNHRSGWAAAAPSSMGEVEHGGGGEGQPGPRRRPRTAALAGRLHHRGVPGRGGDRGRGKARVEQPAGGVTRGDAGQRRGWNRQRRNARTLAA